MKKISWHEFRSQISKRAKNLIVPVSGQFELTARCNFRCQMCYICRPAGDHASKAMELSTKQWLSLLTEARDAGMLCVLFTGGEVFLRSDFKKIYEGAISLGLIPAIFTNASLITPNIINWLRQAPPERLEVTLYGASPESYHAVCGSASAYKKVLQNVDELMAAGIPVSLRTTVTPDNKRDYEWLLQFAHQRNIALRFCFYISPMRVDSENTEVPIPRLGPEELSDYMFRASQDYCRLHEIGKENRNTDECDVEGEEKVSANSSVFRCLAGTNNFWITWKGMMRLCGLMSDPSSNPLETGFKGAFAELHQKMKEIPVCEECGSCELKKICLACPARLKSETGRFDKSSEYLCRFARRQNKHYPKKNTCGSS